ncbi:hypothetical protein NS228_01915 [Methylobacterium indicum]|uniref:Uncharacterized protein n=1 Tax=Methylobacterium indicum TaxID=1775910 RepID=A0ABR5HFK0_9HYPH|nr:hypothetical protein QR78_00835 [Methylobacterium indicum]KMO25277.1 hypothetical protein QR79_08515 [Methylobacterium indicum]KTS23842.1 hypothetical protein NS229_22290 [Methylobacterium indicum]KTS42572.1 hypothetical protein NS228_01915 [Methylobacterium indicum]KTS50300.1 hypothetical protein NS230_16360 [Methylobacterium indicum]
MTSWTTACRTATAGAGAEDGPAVGAASACSAGWSGRRPARLIRFASLQLDLCRSRRHAIIVRAKLASASASSRPICHAAA